MIILDQAWVLPGPAGLQDKTATLCFRHGSPTQPLIAVRCAGRISASGTASITAGSVGESCVLGARRIESPSQDNMLSSLQHYLTLIAGPSALRLVILIEPSKEARS